MQWCDYLHRRNLILFRPNITIINDQTIITTTMAMSVHKFYCCDGADPMYVYNCVQRSSLFLPLDVCV